MSSSSLDAEIKPAAEGSPPASDPNHNPTYPSRDHLLERADLEKAARSCDERISSARQRLSSVANHPKQANFVRLYHQMLGARDQVSEMAPPDAARNRRPLPRRQGTVQASHVRSRSALAELGADRRLTDYEPAFAEFPGRRCSIGRAASLTKGRSMRWPRS